MRAPIPRAASPGLAIRVQKKERPRASPPSAESSMKAAPSSPLWLGLDLGTQSVRALAVAASGGVADLGSHPRDHRPTTGAG